MREVNLSGGEVSIIKALGFGGASVKGADLFQRCTGYEEAEFVDALAGLVGMGYVTTDAPRVRVMDDVKEAAFELNANYVRELREALNPQPKKKPRRVRRE